MIMTTKLLIIITGLPGTGKTSLGKRIAEEFHFPFICKDDFKELLFDSLGSKDRDWSKKIGIASYDILYHVAKEILKADKPLIIETNFDPEFANQRVNELQEKYNCTPFQIRCISDGEILFRRFKDRANTEERHEGHGDGDNLDEWEPILKKGKIEALNIDGEMIDVDTTNFENINYTEIFDAIKTKMSVSE